MKLITTVKRIINEKMGVPDNIVDVAEFLFDKIIGSIHNSVPIEDLVEDGFVIRTNLQVADMPITKFVIGFNLDEYPENALGGVEHYSESEYSDDFILYTEPSKEIRLNIRMLGNKDMVGKDIKEILSNDKNKMISILGHEIKHHYDGFKNRYEGLKTRVDYTSKANVQIGAVQPINDFIFNMYYIHNIENLVRPTELYSLIKTGKITKSGFYKFFTETEIFEKLKRIKNITYDKFIELLKNNIENIKEAFDKNDIDYSGMTDDEIIKRLLDVTIINLNNFKGGSMKDILTQNFGEQIFGFLGKKKEYFKSFVNRLELDFQNSENFFKKEIKYMNINADKMIKKLAKLYDMAEDNPESNLSEITLVHDEVPKPTTKFDTHFKYWSKEKKHPIKKNKPSK
jgi:hypothetical protein